METNKDFVRGGQKVNECKQRGRKLGLQKQDGHTQGLQKVCGK